MLNIKQLLSPVVSVRSCIAELVGTCLFIAVSTGTAVSLSDEVTIFQGGYDAGTTAAPRLRWITGTPHTLPLPLICLFISCVFAASGVAIGCGPAGRLRRVSTSGVTAPRSAVRACLCRPIHLNRSHPYLYV